MQVLDDEHRGSLGRLALEEGAPGGEVLLARGLLRLETEQGAQAGAQQVAVGRRRQDGFESRLRPRDPVTLEDTRARADYL